MASFDPRIVPDAVLAFVRECQRRVPCHLGGGAALAGVHLRHRLSRDVDLFSHDAAEMRVLARVLPDAAAEAGGSLRVVRDAGSLLRAVLDHRGAAVEVDVVHEPAADIEPPQSVDGVWVESLADLRASKLTCILSRFEPRDLVDLLFLDRAGHPPERDLPLALRKDAGIDPGVLAWLLGQFPVEPLPAMLSPLAPEELARFRDEIGERMRRVAVP